MSNLWVVNLKIPLDVHHVYRCKSSKPVNPKNVINGLKPF